MPTPLAGSRFSLGRVVEAGQFDEDRFDLTQVFVFGEPQFALP
jgi:hypothetical protein